MRLLQVMLAAGDGGAETFFEKLAVAFEAAGIEQRLVICRNAARAGRLREAGCEVVEIPARGWRKWMAKGRVGCEVEAFRPAVAMAWMSRAAAALSEVPGVVNVARLGGYYPLKYYRHCHHLVGNTPGVVDHLVKAGWPAERVSLISNFADGPGEGAGRDLRDELQIPAGAPVLLSVGRLHPNKAHDIALRALARLPGVVLLLAGGGDLREELGSLAEALGVAERVRFLGWRTDVHNLYATADACLFPSRVEPLGNVILEAWAHGLPVAAAASEGPAWLIQDGKNGLLFPVDDVEGAVSAAERLLRDRDLGARLVEGGRETLETRFSRERIVQDYRELFARLVAGGATGAVQESSSS